MTYLACTRCGCGTHEHRHWFDDVPKPTLDGRFGTCADCANCVDLYAVRIARPQTLRRHTPRQPGQTVTGDDA